MDALTKNTEEISASIDATLRDISRINLKLFYLTRANLEWIFSSNMELWELTAKETRKQYNLFKEANRDYSALLNKEIGEMVHSGR